MLNLRLAQPELLVDITRIQELVRVETSGDHITIGRAYLMLRSRTGAFPDPGQNFFLPGGEGIAYRAVRNRGTLGEATQRRPGSGLGSLFFCARAEILIPAQAGNEVGIDDFLVGAMETTLVPEN
ncbi:MAG: hypothetical protein CM1200mP20_00580 [Pseudomonadota bacterium]|nr:MAG: hypothetical protein CM1200mP20_00580 [Pseudomonadota bacterium]